MANFTLDYEALNAATTPKSKPFNPVLFIIEERDKGRVFTEAEVISLCFKPTRGPDDHENWKKAFKKEVRRQKIQWLFGFFANKEAECNSTPPKTNSAPQGR